MLYSYIVLQMSLFLLIPLSLCLISMTATFFSIAFSKQIGTVRSIYINSLFICRCYEICFLNCKDVHKTSCGAIATESSSVQLLRTPRSQVRLRRARSDCETKRYDYDSHTPFTSSKDSSTTPGNQASSEPGNNLSKQNVEQGYKAGNSYSSCGKNYSGQVVFP